MSDKPTASLLLDWMRAAFLLAPTIEPVRTNDPWITTVSGVRVLAFADGILPTITSQPSNQSAADGGTATFSVTATNATSYQWQVNTGGGFANISGATSASYVIGVVEDTDDGNLYHCVVTGPGGITTSDSASLTVSPEGAALVATSPTAWKLIQQSGGTANISITGTATSLNGTDVEASFNGGAYATLGTISSGTFSGTLSAQAAGRGTLTVRSVDYPSISTTVANVGIGNLYLVTGDSISEGRGTSAQSHGLASLKPSAYRQDDAWIEANDPCDTGTVGGSQWPLLAAMLTTDSSVPVGFVTTGTGSKDLVGSGVAYYAKPGTGYSIITSQSGEVGNTFAAMLLHFGPNAATDVSITRASYKTSLETFATNIRADIQASLNLYIGCYGRSDGFDNRAVRNGIVDAVNATASLLPGPNLLGLAFGDGVHPKSDAHLVQVAGRWWAALSEGLYAPNISGIAVSGTTITLTFDSDLDPSVTNYTTTLWRLNQSGSYSTPSSATRTDDRDITIVFASITDSTAVLDFVFDESHISATMPTSVPVNLPLTIHGVSSVVQPCNPFADYSVPVSTSVQVSGAGWLSGTPSNVFANANDFTIAMTYDDDATSGYLLSMNSTGLLVILSGSTIQFGNGTGWAEFAYSAGDWRFIYDRSETGFDRLRAFRNGTELTRTGTSGTYANFAVPSVAMNLGRRTSGVSYAQGTFTGVKVWSRIVTPDDVDQTTNLTLFLNQVVGTTWYDDSSSNTDFTLNGDAAAV